MSKNKINTVGGNGSFDGIIDRSPRKVQSIAKELRGILASVLPGVTEVPWEKQRTIGYGIGPKKMSQHFCYLGPQKDYVNLGFMQGAKLFDPKNLLAGEGKLIRHIKISSVQEVRRPQLRKLIEEAKNYLSRTTSKAV